MFYTKIPCIESAISGHCVHFHYIPVAYVLSTYVNTCQTELRIRNKFS